jgi:hypothetical protein
MDALAGKKRLKIDRSNAQVAGGRAWQTRHRFCEPVSSQKKRGTDVNPFLIFFKPRTVANIGR